MPIIITIAPDIPDTVVWNFTGAWTWEEFSQAAFCEMPALFKSAHLCHASLILNMDAALHPPLIGSFQFMRDTIQSNAHAIDQIVVVSQQQFIQFMIATFNRLYTQCVRPLTVVYTLEQASRAITASRTGDQHYWNRREMMFL